jgi:DNA-binding CsgD family transcriptional regulator
VSGVEIGTAAVDALTADERARAEPLANAAGNTTDPRVMRCGLALTLAYAGRFADAAALAGALGEETIDQPTWRGLHGSGDGNIRHAQATAQAAFGQPAEAQHAYAAARACYQALGHHAMLGNASFDALLQVAIPYRADSPGERGALAEEAAGAWARTMGARDDLPPGQARLPLLLLEGRWVEADDLAPSPDHASSVAAIGWIARERGDPGRAWGLVARHLPDGPSSRPGDALFLPAVALQRLAAALALDAGDLPAARAWLAAHDRWLGWSGAMLGLADGHLGWASYHRAAGVLAQARQHAELALAHAREPRQPLALLGAHRTLGELDTIAGRHAEALSHLEQSLALSDACAAPYERARTLLTLASLHATEGRREAALALLEESRAICIPLDARPAIARIDALAATLSAVGGTRSPHPAGLSAREAEVLRLVAQGLSNAEVAARLSLSVRTIEQHLRTIYNKLDVPSRSAATRFAIDHKLA